ncbi:MAG: YfaZ family outer membrane protein, partial [Pseudomonadota bacterium]
HAQTIDLNVNNDTVRAGFIGNPTERGLRIDAGWLHNQDRGDVIHIGVHAVGDMSSGNQSLEGGLGGKVFHIEPDVGGESATVLGIGAYGRYVLPAANRVSIYGHVYFAPDVLAFGDGKRYAEIEAHLAYNVLRNADVYLGARYSNVDFDGADDVTLDSGLHVGIQLRF